MKIGVFDSGIGGKSIANAIKKSLPEHEIIYQQDRENVPYGLKTPEELTKLVFPILQNMVSEGAEVLVIACNTVTTTIIDKIRENFDLPVVGIEPMIKPASQQTKSKVIAVCATPTTLASRRYQHLIEEYAQGLTIEEPDCSQWAYMIEQSNIDQAILKKSITEVCEKGADVIVLGCTHYHWIEEDIKLIAEKYNAQVIQPEKAVVDQLKRVIEQLD